MKTSIGSMARIIASYASACWRRFSARKTTWIVQWEYRNHMHTYSKTIEIKVSKDKLFSAPSLEVAVMFAEAFVEDGTPEGEEADYWLDNPRLFWVFTG